MIQPPLQSTRGFTLLELLVVMMIIGIIVSFAVLSVGQDPTRKVEEEVHRLNALIELARQEGMLEAQEFAVQIHRNGYQFLQLQQNDKAWQWQPITGKGVFRPRCLPPGMEMKLELEGEPAILETMSCEKLQEQSEQKDDSESQSSIEGLTQDQEKEFPRVFLLSSGEITPFEVTLMLEDKGLYRLAGELTGAMHIYSADENKL
jgi:general secretion pathway protein H